MLIKVKMPAIVGILTFISRINTTFESLKARNFFISWYFSFYEQLKFRALLSMKKFYNLSAWFATRKMLGDLRPILWWATLSALWCVCLHYMYDYKVATCITPIRRKRLKLLKEKTRGQCQAMTLERHNRVIAMLELALRPFPCSLAFI